MRLTSEKIQRYILKKYRRQDFYGYQLQKDLAEDGFEIDITRLYRLLKEMEKIGLLTYKWEKSLEGPMKKMYKIGEKGVNELNEILLEAIGTVHSFYGDYLVSIRKKIDVFDLILKPISKKITSSSHIGFFFQTYTPLVGLFFKKIRETFDAQYYCIKPRGIAIEDYPDNVTAINGNYNDIPLKVDHLDALIIIDLPNQSILQSSVNEWSRVMKIGGVLSILTPNIMIKDEIDPISIGEFVEKAEHQIIEKGSVINFMILNQALETHFKEIEINTVVHMSTITSVNNFKKI